MNKKELSDKLTLLVIRQDSQPGVHEVRSEPSFLRRQVNYEELLRVVSSSGGPSLIEAVYNQALGIMGKVRTA